MIEDFLLEFRRYKTLSEKAIEQVSDEALDHVPAPDGNSIAMLVRHIGGNLKSRFTDFLRSDGEKEWRRRDEEFLDRPFDGRQAMLAYWEEGWAVVLGEVGALADGQASDIVRIRGQELTVHAALARSLAHVAYHSGQIVLLARMLASGDWRYLSISRGESAAYNRNPTLEKSPKNS